MPKVVAKLSNNDCCYVRHFLVVLSRLLLHKRAPINSVLVLDNFIDAPACCSDGLGRTVVAPTVWIGLCGQTRV